MARRSFSIKNKKPSNRSYSLRMGQLLGPYSIGAIYPCDANTVVMVAGLDAFSINVMEPVIDTRLAKYIGVNKLLAPPAYETKSRNFVPAVRFPGWLYCPRCGRMEHVSANNTSPWIECSNPECKKESNRAVRLVPERFVVACPAGHIDDFPVREWVHGGDVPAKGHTMTRNTSGGSATLGDIVYKCSCGAKRTLFGATYGEGLQRIDYHCSGRQPWLDTIDQRRCKVDPGSLRVVQMGGTNVCYADVISSVLIPDSLDKVVKELVAEHFDAMVKMEKAGMLDTFIHSICGDKVDPSAVSLAFELIKTKGSTATNEGDYLHEEYETLLHPTLIKKGEFVGETVDPAEYDSPIIGDFFSSLTLIDTLTVTRALVGFSRLNPEANEGKDFSERRKMLSNKKLDWTLALQTKGEGIFIELDQAKLEEWRERPEVMSRFSIMQEHLNESLASRNQPLKLLNPDYVALHTLAHLLILGISEICGYAAASLRERIYCDKYLDHPGILHPDMHGFLIYTASDSSDGSLGGLVRSGKPGRLEDTIHKALDKALWCSGDPVCIESHGQGPDSCNLAACYSCALVPETSCESGNRLLDRGLLVGTLESSSAGLFGQVLR